MRKNTKSSRLEKIKRICLVALMLALTTIFCFVPVQFGTITLALMILPTLIVACCCDFKTSAIMGLAMGLINYIAWFTTKAASPVAPVFQNPLVCILPRFLIAVTTYLTRIGLEKSIFKTAFARRHPYEYQRLVGDDEKSQNNDISDATMQTDDILQSDFSRIEQTATVSKSQKKYNATDAALHQIIRSIDGCGRDYQYAVRCNFHSYLFQQHVHCAKHRRNGGLRACVVRAQFCNRSGRVFTFGAAYCACLARFQTCKIIEKTIQISIVV